MAGTGVGKFSSTASSNTANLTVNFAENMAPSNVNNAARELMAHIRDMYEQLGDGYFEFGDGDGTYTIARVDADTLTIATAADLSAIYFAGRKIRVTDGGANVVEGTITSTSHGSSLQTVNLTGITLASGAPTKVELGIDTAAFGGKIILDDDGDTYIEAPTDDTIDIYVAGAKDFVITANTFTAESGSTIAAQALTATTVTASGIVKTDDTTNATSTTDGSLQTDGGLSVALDAVIGDDLFMKSDAAVIHFGADSDVTLTHVADKGLTLSTATGDDSLTLQSTLADNNSAPRLKLHRASGSPADNDLLGAITWSFLDDGGNSHEAAFIRATATDVSNGSEDATLEVNVDVAGSDVNRMSFNAVEAVFNEGSADIDFRVESNGNANMFTINAGTDKVGIGDNPDLGLLHVKSADSGGSVNVAADELVIENNGSAGITILTSNTTSGSIHFGDDGDNDKGFISYSHNTDDMFFSVNGNGSAYSLVLFDGGQVSTGGETAPDGGDGGLCLDQNANDGNILTFKSSDIAHNITGEAESDTYMRITKSSSTAGGFRMDALSEQGGEIMQFIALGNTDGGSVSTATSTSGTGSISFGVNLSANNDGAANDSVADAGNLAVFRNYTATQFIIKGNGAIHSNAAAGTYDSYEDAQLVRAFDLTNKKGVIASQFDKYVSYNHDALADAELVGRDEDGTPNMMMNITGFIQLHNGAIWQQYEKTERLANAVYELAKAAVGEDKANEILEQNEIKLLN